MRSIPRDLDIAATFSGTAILHVSVLPYAYHDSACSYWPTRIMIPTCQYWPGVIPTAHASTFRPVQYCCISILAPAHQYWSRYQIRVGPYSTRTCVGGISRNHEHKRRPTRYLLVPPYLTSVPYTAYDQTRSSIPDAIIPHVHSRKTACFSVHFAGLLCLSSQQSLI